MPVKYWGIENIEENTQLQAERLGRSPVVKGHVALMPDGHVGAGATIGSVFVSDTGMIPAAIGVDIGCGMIAVQTSLNADHLPDNLTGLHDEFARSIPSGIGPRGGRSQPRDQALIWLQANQPPQMPEGFTERVQRQLGTLGSGNHFLEVCLDEDSQVWVVLHSGSRGIGNKLADIHIKKAKDICRLAGIALEDPDLAYFLTGSPEFQAYVADMLWAQDYAYHNRTLMMDEALNQLFRFVGAGKESRRVNCHHNYSIREIHNGEEVWVTRKGAVRAREGDLAVIPGSMGSRSYITKGKGNPDSYNSCAHGAGRRMSRSQAKRELSVDEFTASMDAKGITWNRAGATNLIDESERAYKDIDEVMSAQADLVEVVYVLRQVVNYKGEDAGWGHKRKRKRDAPIQPLRE